LFEENAISTRAGKNAEHIHLLGIAGAAMSPVAGML
jgi:UDP-N-acetylmuramate-alanine ligase